MVQFLEFLLLKNSKLYQRYKIYPWPKVWAQANFLILSMRQIRKWIIVFLQILCKRFKKTSILDHLKISCLACILWDENIRQQDKIYFMFLMMRIAWLLEVLQISPPWKFRVVYLWVWAIQVLHIAISLFIRGLQESSESRLYNVFLFTDIYKIPKYNSTTKTEQIIQFIYKKKWTRCK